VWSTDCSVINSQRKCAAAPNCPIVAHDRNRKCFSCDVLIFFRYINRKTLEPLWNRDYIKQVEVVMKERDNVAGNVVLSFVLVVIWLSILYKLQHWSNNAFLFNACRKTQVNVWFKLHFNTGIQFTYFKAHSDCYFRNDQHCNYLKT